MKKIIVTLTVLVFALLSVQAQDIIIKRNGEEIKSKVKTVSSGEIEYYKYESSEGIIYRIAKSEVLLIMYENGTKDIFSTDNSNSGGGVSGKQGRTTASTATRPAQVYYNYDFFDKKVPLVYLGIDFTYAKLIGNDFEEPKKLFGELNALLAEEKGKYDMNGAVRRSDLPYLYGIVEKRNDTITEKLLTDNIGAVITFRDLQNIVDSYDLSTIGVNDGLALVLICENLNTARVDGVYYYVIFDVLSKKVVISDRLIGKAGGKGQRNYWARTIYDTIVILRDRKFGQWKSMFRK